MGKSLVSCFFWDTVYYAVPWLKYSSLRCFWANYCGLHGISGSYITVRSDIGQAGDQVTLWSPTESFRRGSLLSFAFHMWLSDDDTTAALSDDDTTAALSDDDTTAALCVYTYSPMHVYERRLLEIRGNHGISWHKVSVCLPEGTYQVAFVATHGLQFLSDIALSDVELHNHDIRCDSVYDSHKGKYFTNTIYCLHCQWS